MSKMIIHARRKRKKDRKPCATPKCMRYKIEGGEYCYNCTSFRLTMVRRMMLKESSKLD